VLRPLGGELERHVEIGGLDDPEAAEVLLRLQKGPSVTIASPPRLSMTVAVLGEARPPAKTQWPSAWSRSLNTSIAAISSGVARPAGSWITETRYCI
jgi:hypothetical protein